ncbi:hypothetical protein ACQZ5N_21645 [Agrobacterium sp. 22-221-1]
MNLAVVVMTILGCADGGINCRYIATVDHRWETVLACNDVSESRLLDYRDKPYPVIVAVCQKPEIKSIWLSSGPGNGLRRRTSETAAISFGRYC